MPTLTKRRALARWPLTVSVVAMAVAACVHKADSKTKDVFVQDQGDPTKGNDRRHPASKTEALWAVYLATNEGWCSAHLIAPEVMMTAGHCLPQVGFSALSGYAISQGQKRSDISVTEVLEIDHTLDYAIVRIKWTNGYPAQQRFPAKVATKAADITVDPASGKGDPVFTVGFPQDLVDNWGATYAQGNLKAVDSATLFYNIGTINGNSGGGVWRQSDHMLVTLTNGGAHVFNQAGWNTGSADDAATWNTGAAMWEIYAASATLRDTFPNGVNRFPGADTGAAPDTGVAAGSDLWVLIGEPDNASVDTFTLYVSAPAAATNVVFCTVASPADCDANANGYTVGALSKSAGDRAIFKGGRTTTLTNGMSLSVIATDDHGKVVASRTVTINSAKP